VKIRERGKTEERKGSQTVLLAEGKKKNEARKHKGTAGCATGDAYSGKKSTGEKDGKGGSSLERRRKILYRKAFREGRTRESESQDS